MKHLKLSFALALTLAAAGLKANNLASIELVNIAVFNQSLSETAVGDDTRDAVRVTFETTVAAIGVDLAATQQLSVLKIQIQAVKAGNVFVGFLRGIWTHKGAFMRVTGVDENGQTQYSQPQYLNAVLWDGSQIVYAKDTDTLNAELKRAALALSQNLQKSYVEEKKAAKAAGAPDTP